MDIAELLIHIFSLLTTFNSKNIVIGVRLKKYSWECVVMGKIINCGDCEWSFSYNSLNVMF